MLSLNVVPVHQWTHRQFNGVDPWAGNGQAVIWSLVVYRMLSESFIDTTPVAQPAVGPESNAIPANLSVGIYARAHNRYRVLPLALQDLFRSGEVRDYEIPWLLRQVEERLLLCDYPPGNVTLLMLVYGIGLGLFAVLSLMVNLLGMAFALITLAALCLGIFLWLNQRRSRLAREWRALLGLARRGVRSQNAP